MQLHLFDFIAKKDITSKMIPISTIIFLLVFGENLITPIFSIFINSITNNVFHTGIVLSLIGFIGIVMSIPMGIITDKFNIKNLILLSIGSFILVPIFYVLYQNIISLFIIRILSSIISTLLWCAVWTYVYSKVDNDHRAEEISVASRAIKLAASFSPIIGGFIAILAFLLPFYIVSLVFLLAFFVAAVTLKDPEPRKMDSFSYLFKKDMVILKNIFSKYKTLIFAGTVAFAVITSIYAFLPIILVQKGFDFLRIGMIFAISLFPAFLFEAKIGTWIDRIGNAKVLALSLVVLAFTAIVLSVSFHLAILIPIMIIFGFGNTFAFISFASLLSEWSDEEDRGLLSGIRKALMSVGAAFGPFFTGLVLVLGGTKIVMIFLAILSLGTVLLFVFNKSNLFNKEVVLESR